MSLFTRILVGFVLLTATCAMWPAASCLADGDRPWVVRRPADMTVLPLDEVLQSGKDPVEQSAEPGPEPAEPAEGATTDATTDAGQPTAAEPAKPEPAKPEPATAEPAKPEPTKPEPATAEPAKPEPTKPEPATAEPAVAAAEAKPESGPAAEPDKKAGSGELGVLVVTPTATGVRLVLPLSGEPGDLRFLNLPAPKRRLAIDVMGQWKNAGQRHYEVESEYVTRLEVGGHPDFVRVVVHLTDKATSADIKPGVKKGASGVELEIKAAP